MASTPQSAERRAADPKNSEFRDRWLPWLVIAASLFVLFYRLGAAALFEPDEGRNAEKAREILLLNNWVTPHENFHPVLDKPIFFYWLIAISYKIFGISEWAARLPSALAALGCVGLVYGFARRRWGNWEALWAGLILLTNMEFFVFARVVIFDMPLTFFLTLALCAFYQASHTESANRRRVSCLLMYGAFGAATLIKGLIGIVIPGMVIFFYLALTKQWRILRRIHLLPGALFFLAIVSPWYLQAGAQNDGYLRYYLWEEHFGRFATTEFHRTQPWYYFILVGSAGFFPWTVTLPFLATRRGKKLPDDRTLFLLLWIALPLIFFSLSQSKLPHYILPIFPALALLTATALVRLYRESPAQVRRALSFAGILQTLIVLYLIAASLWPMLLPKAQRDTVGEMTALLWIFGAATVFTLVYILFNWAKDRLQGQATFYLLQGCFMVCFLCFLVEMMVSQSIFRSAKELAARAIDQVTPATQVVFYDTYQAGMAFYLRTQKPIWLITHGNKRRTFLGNYYTIGKRREPLTQWGKAMLTFDEFREKWQTGQEPLLIIVKRKNLQRLTDQVGGSPRVITMFDEFAILAKP